MRIYTVFTPSLLEGIEVAPDAEAVKEGFCWPALILSVFWALWHRLWMAALIFFAASVALGAVLVVTGAGVLTSATASLGMAALIGWAANDLRSAQLLRRGFAERSPVIAPTGDLAIQRYFEAGADL